MTDRFTSQLKLLTEVRKTLEAAVFDEDTLARDLPPLTKRLLETCHDIETLRERAKAEGQQLGKDTVDDRLNLLKRIQRRLSTAAFREKTAPRDLAALTRRLQDVSSDIATLEERIETEGGQNGSASTAKATGKGSWNPDTL